MTRPQKYDPALGLQGNLENALWNNQYNSNNISNNKASYDVDHIAMEQALTEADINNIVAEQTITDMDLRLIEVEGKING